MTRRWFPAHISLLTAAILLIGCTPEDYVTATDSTRPFVQRDTSDQAVLDVVMSYIWERTEEGTPYYILATATDFERIEPNVDRNDSDIVCRARFKGEGRAYLVEYHLVRDFESYAIDRIVLAQEAGRPANDLLYDRAALIQ